MKDKNSGGFNATHIDVIETCQWHRGWISSYFAQIEYMLGDLIAKCRAFPEYSEQTKNISHSASKRVAKIRAMIEKPGPLKAYAERLETVLSAFLENYETRNLLAHGFTEFHLTPGDDYAMVYKRFVRGEDGTDVIVQRVFRPNDLDREHGKLGEIVGGVMELFVEIHEKYGWLGKNDGDIRSLFNPQ